ncbi:hypothetical protein THIX_30683 [Thiomonas sp. X19]|nr:hypothetical protein THIX_30683 [Thiomonas sp. X19]
MFMGVGRGFKCPPGSTNIDAQLRMQLGIFLVRPRVYKGSCESLRTSRFRGLTKILPFLLSLGRFSLRPRSPEVARSPQRPAPLHL